MSGSSNPPPLLPQHNFPTPDQVRQSQERNDKKANATTGASAAGVRAITARLVSFYFRIPVKAFFRARVDYLAYPRAINPLAQTVAGQPQSWSWRLTSPFLLASAVRQHGWTFLPSTVLPPLLANVTIGAVLYTSYLQFLSLYHPGASSGQARIYPPPSLASTFLAGSSAGAIQSVLAAPIDALTIRFRTTDLTSRKYPSMWHYAAAKLSAIGVRGAYAGFSLGLFKDALSAGLFFSSFEMVKSQCFYAFVRRWYVEGHVAVRRSKANGDAEMADLGRPSITPHYMIEPAFLLLAGVSASVAQQLILHPVTQVQDVYCRRLPWVDAQLAAVPVTATSRAIGTGRQVYRQAYRKTLHECAVHARRAGGWRAWLFADFWRSTLRQVPGTSAGLIVFEVFRRKYGVGAETVERIEMDGYDILLP